MARTDLIQPNFAGFGVSPARPSGGLLRGLRNFLSGLAEGWTAYRAWNNLNALSDGQLRRLGVERRDIPRFVMFGRVSGHTE